MGVVSARASSRIRRIGRIVATCESHDSADLRELRRSLLDQIRAEVPFDAYAWLLTDPETSVGTSPIADVPCLAELPALIRGRYQSVANRWTTPGIVPVALLSVAAGRAGGEWAAMLGRHGVADVATTVFRDRFGCWGFLDLWRTGLPAGSATASGRSWPSWPTEDQRASYARPPPAGVARARQLSDGRIDGAR